MADVPAINCNGVLFVQWNKILVTFETRRIQGTGVIVDLSDAGTHRYGVTRIRFRSYQAIATGLWLVWLGIVHGVWDLVQMEKSRREKQ